MQPDLVIAWRSGGSFQSVERLIGLGMKVYVNEISSPKDIAFSLEKLGVLVGQKTWVRAFYKFSKEIIEIEESRIDSHTLQFFNSKQRSIYFNEQHFLGSAIKVCSAQNVFLMPLACLPSFFESVVRKNPDLIVAGKSSDAPTQSRKSGSIGWGHKMRFVDSPSSSCLL